MIKLKKASMMQELTCKEEEKIKKFSQGESDHMVPESE
jgi:hypothetical protein